MLTCRQATELATDRAEGTLEGGLRAALAEHLGTCEGCRTYLRQLELARRALAHLPAPEPSPELAAGAMRAFDAWAAAPSAPAEVAPEAPPDVAPEPAPRRRRSPWSLAATLATLLLLVAFARQRSVAPGDWAIGAALAGASLAIASLSGRWALGAAGAAVAAAVAAALVGAGAGPLDLLTGLECLGIELGAAGALGGLSWLLARRGGAPPARASLATGALAGALAADAALQLTCHAHEGLPHVAVFHVGGVLLVAAATALLLGPRRAAARS